MVSETREFIPILIFLGLYCTDSIWFYHSRPLGQSNSVAGSSFSRWQQCRRQRWGACWSWQQKICRKIRLFGNCTKDEMTERTVLKNRWRVQFFCWNLRISFNWHIQNNPPKGASISTKTVGFAVIFATYRPSPFAEVLWPWPMPRTSEVPGDRSLTQDPL